MADAFPCNFQACAASCRCRQIFQPENALKRRKPSDIIGLVSLRDALCVPSDETSGVLYPAAKSSIMRARQQRKFMSTYSALFGLSPEECSTAIVVVPKVRNLLWKLEGCAPLRAHGWAAQLRRMLRRLRRIPACGRRYTLARAQWFATLDVRNPRSSFSWMFPGRKMTLGTRLCNGASRHAPFLAVEKGTTRTDERGADAGAGEQQRDEEGAAAAESLRAGSTPGAGNHPNRCHWGSCKITDVAHTLRECLCGRHAHHLCCAENGYQECNNKCGHPACAASHAS